MAQKSTANNSKGPQVKKRRGDYDDPANHHTNPWLFELTIGLFAGLFWGVVRWLLYEINFTVELPGFLVEPFFRNSFLKSPWGITIGISGFIVFSIIAALIYYFLFAKLRGPWPGVLYGLLWWAILFVFTGPMLQMTKPITEAGWNTLTTELCIFMLWGLFIGYSTAFEYTDEASREPIGAR
ncbi:YqhR family membrane protein [Paenibacillus sp. NEAU-GSW1]|uniref:YqhR family membrane protein n=1 Tax=Paenibacillus sp. NEAU-GSW1 TaxID=2682486 RepID=UPI0012E11C69|nr:YqhR family membrane protein [Paenibacillus sp. NEAU-GSW1]MUT66732.1 hypothetical protein [Paenibacillus sp. NEAU-GSW1]